jgi:hypothetical protein
MPEKIMTATTEGMRKRLRPRKRWTGGIEEEGMEKNFLLEAEVHKGMLCLKRRIN